MSEVKKVSWENYRRLLAKEQRKIDEMVGFDTITLCERGGTLNHPEIDIQVSWASIGAVPVEVALEFASAIRYAAKLAEDFPYNGCVIDY